MLSNNYKDEDYVHYVYKITNNINNRYYIGIHSFPKESGYTPLTDGYWGSGSEITKDIRSLGRENFTKEIISICSTREEISIEEKRLVTIDVVRSIDSYNLILGGDSNYESNIGWVVCRPKNAINKVIKITRNEYYSNKDLYVPTGHLKYYLETKDMTEEQLEDRKKNLEEKYKYKYEHKNKNKELREYTVVKKFVNRDTLEVKMINKKEVLNLYEVWYPQYFLDKSSNIFITKEYLLSEYKNLPNINKLSRKFNISFRSLKKIIKYYNIEDQLKDSNGTRGHTKNLGFTGKMYVHNEFNELVIKKEDLEKYLLLGYKRGKFININVNEVYNFYVKGNGIKVCAKKFKTSDDTIKKILNLNNSSLMWFHSNILHKSGHFLIADDNMLNDFNKNGWELGRKNF